MTMDFNAFLKEHIDHSLAEVWQGSVVKHIEVYKSNSSWALHVTIPRPIPVTLIDQTTNNLRDCFAFLEQVQIVPVLLDWNSGLEWIMEQRRSELIDQVFNQAEMLQELNWETDSERIDFLVENEEHFEYLIGGDICTNLSSWVFQEYGLRILVRALYTQPIPPANSCCSPEVRSQELNLLTITPAVASRKKGYNRRDEGLKLNGAEITAIAELQEGQKNIVIEGEVWGKEVTALKGGRLAVIYYLTDYRDSINVKCFVDDPEDDKLQRGSWYRIGGDIRYDDNTKEIAMFMQGYEAAEKAVRHDQAPVKRIELHAHTKMSAMDGLTEIKDLVKRAIEWRQPALAITDHGCIQAFPEAFKTAKDALAEARKQDEDYHFKLILGVEAYLVENDAREKPWHIILLARDRNGLKNMYDLVSMSYLDNFYKHPKITRADLTAKREGLIIGSACEAGELFKALLEGMDTAAIEAIAAFYDYLEIQPLPNNAYLVREGRLKTEEELQDINRRIVELGKKLGKPVCATGDVHFLDPHHEVFRRIIQAGQGYEDAEVQAPLYFKTTEEMLEECSYLGAEDARAVVIDNPQAVSEIIEDLRPVPTGFYPPAIDGAEEEIVALTWQRARELYGDTMPVIVDERIKRELHSITTNGFSVLYLIAHKLVDKSNRDGYMVGSRGSVGSSLVAYLTGITEVNPLTPHYLCPDCHYSEFITGSVACGADLALKDCPCCGQELNNMGFDIPFETFLGFKGDKTPDIDLNFSGDYQSKAHQYVEELFGSSNVIRAGTITTIADRTAFGFVKKYAEGRQVNMRQVEIKRLAASITGVRRSTGQHPGGLIVVPKDHDIREFTPLQHPANKQESGIITSHFDYHAVDEQLVKLDILGHDDPTVIRELEDLTGIKVSAIRLNEEKAMAIFSGLESLGVSEKEIGTSIGTYGIPEFGTRFVRQMLEATRPTTFSELVRISGLSHGTNVWLNNAQALIENEVATLNEVICTRDDIMTYLIYQGVEEKQSFDIMELVRKGKGSKLTPAQIGAMRDNGVPEWYIDSCLKIEYMFPKAHAVAYVMMAFRIAWFKVYYPREFYASFFSIRAEDFDPENILQGKGQVRERIREINRQGMQAAQKDKKLLPILELALEMYARGFVFHPVDLYRSDAKKFLVEPDGLLLPLSALPNLGGAAAQLIVDARDGCEYVSVEDFQQRSHINKTTLEVLRKHGCLEGLPESTQLSLFA
ncbi:MAG: PolC-type DNA polymerase III [Deltaproteobacteria bacterium]